MKTYWSWAVGLLIIPVLKLWAADTSISGIEAKVAATHEAKIAVSHAPGTSNTSRSAVSKPAVTVNPTAHHEVLKTVSRNPNVVALRNQTHDTVKTISQFKNELNHARTETEKNELRRKITEKELKLRDEKGALRKLMNEETRKEVAKRRR